jgi:hypothetical protein
MAAWARSEVSETLGSLQELCDLQSKIRAIAKAPRFQRVCSEFPSKK